MIDKGPTGCQFYVEHAFDMSAVFLHNEIPAGMIRIEVADFLTFNSAFNKIASIHSFIDLNWLTSTSQ